MAETSNTPETQTQPQTQPQEAAKPKKDKTPKESIRAVHGGPMLNPNTQDVFTGEPSKPVVVDDWIKVQIEAGKLEVVKDEE